jgi:hypothetical protein
VSLYPGQGLTGMLEDFCLVTIVSCSWDRSSSSSEMTLTSGRLGPVLHERAYCQGEYMSHAKGMNDTHCI